ncbi:MAG TPA: carboxynorspermidine decarboxylase [Elusimicrobiota bacterium]|nr:carboxynorspermidine decarboxylase [Elusimicrobiota bacterium]
MTLAEPSIEQLLTETRSRPTPFYLLDETRLLRNLRRITRLRERSGAKAVLALKCFSTWSVFPLMREHLDGTTSSSLFEARLGHETFGKETHAYSVAFSDADIEAVRGFATKVIFNSTSQLLRYHDRVKHLPVGLRINPGVSHSHFDLADPARPRCRLGATSAADIDAVADRLSGVMFHCQCENDDFEKFKFLLDRIAADYGPLLKRLDWVSLGGGIYFTKEGYPLDDLAEALRDFAARFDVQVYLEPGEAAITRTAYLVTSVLDLVRNEVDIAVVDSAVEPHMLDLLIYRTDAKMDLPSGGRFPYTVAGKTCLAGDVFGTFQFPAPLAVGDRVAFADAAGYTMVKKNWFNGVAMPSIVVRRLDGRLDAVRDFTYDDYRSQLS